MQTLSNTSIHVSGTAMRKAARLSVRLAVLLCWTALIYAQVLPDCGGEDQHACHPFDKEFWQTTSLVCEYDLQLKAHLFHQGTCVDRERRTLDKDYSWLGWALSEQRYNIGADLGINYGTHLGTHNSFSDYQQGFGSKFSVNQWYSITDQLQGGARTLRLDPVWYYDEMRLCHSDSLDFCKVSSPGRLFASAVREIGAWLDANPGEVIILRVHDVDLTDHKDYFNKPIETYLGSKVFAQTEKSLGYQGRWPTMREMRSAGRQIIIFSQNDYGAGWSFNKGAYFWEADPNDGTFGDCTSNPTSSSVRGRNTDQWALISEGRTESDDPLFGNFRGLLNESDVTTAAECSFSNIEVDFFLRLDKAYGNFARGSDRPDRRKEASIWSWQQDDYGQRGPALLDVPSHRWRSLLAANIYPFLCMKPDPAGSPTNATWRVTSATGVWNKDNGDSVCAAEMGAGYTFSFPRNALQNKQVLDAARNYPAVWLGYSTIPIPEPSAGPPVIRFIMNRAGTLPDAQSTLVFGTVGDGKRTFSAQLLSGDQYFSIAIPSNQLQLQGAPITVSVNPIAATLSVGVYQGAIRLSESGNSASGDSAPGGTISVALEILEPTTNTLSIPVSSVFELTQTTITATIVGRRLPDLQDSITGTVVLRDEVTDPATGRTTVQDLQNAFLGGFGDDATGADNVARFALTLPVGVHTLHARYLGDSHYGPSDSDAFTVTIKPLIRVDPPSIVFSVPITGPLPGPWTVNAFDVLPPVVPPNPTSGFFSIPAANASNGGRIPIYASVTPTGFSATSATVTLDPGLRVLPPGQYDLDVQFVRGDRAPAPVVSHLSMKLLGTLSASSPQVNFAVGGPMLQKVHISGSGTGMPLTVTTTNAPWLSAEIFPLSTPADLIINADPTGLAPGDYQANVTVTSPLSENSISVLVTSHVIGATTISTNVPNGTVVVDRQSFPSPATFYWDAGSHHNVSAQTIEQLDATTRWRFLSWNDGLAATHAVIVLTSQGLTLICTYAPEYKLSADAVPAGAGSIVSNPASVDGFYSAGTAVSVNAQPASGYSFIGFSGAVSGTTTPGNVVMDAPKALTAAFAAKFADVQIASLPAGLVVTVDGVATPAGQSFHWQVGTPHTIGAATSQGELNGARFSFTQWSDAGAASHQITTPNAPAAITASYRKQYQLTVNASPANGGAVSGAGWYDEQSSATVSATAAQGFNFTGFSGAFTGLTNPQTVTVNAALQVKANFAPATPIVYATPGARADASVDTRSVVISLANSGGLAAMAQIDSITDIKAITGAGDVHLTSTFPMVGADIPTGGSTNLPTLWKWPDTAKRVQFTVNFSANAGSYHGSTTLTMFR